MRWMKIAELSLRKDFTATEVSETLGERFKESTSHSAWSLLKAIWISTSIFKASRSLTQNSDHPQLSHTFRPPQQSQGEPSGSWDSQFSASHISWPHGNYPQHRRELSVLAGSLGWRGRQKEKATALQLTWLPREPTHRCKAPQGRRWTLRNLRHKWSPSDGEESEVPHALGRSLRRIIMHWREVELQVAPWWGTAPHPLYWQSSKE